MQGASFADDQLQGIASEYQQLESEFRAQAFQQEMQASTQLIEQETASLLTQAAQELGELGVAATFLQGVNQAAQTLAGLEAKAKQDEILAKYGQVGLPSPQGPVGGIQGPVDFAGLPIVPPAPGAPVAAPPPSPAAAPPPATLPRRGLPYTAAYKEKAASPAARPGRRDSRR